MSDTKCYAVDCYGNGFSKPSVAVFTIDRAMATFLLKMSQIVRDNGLELVAKSTDLVWWFREDPRADLYDAELQAVVENPALIELNEDDERLMSMSVEQIHVTADSFHFTCIDGDNEPAIETEGVDLLEMAQHFGLVPDENAGPPQQKLPFD